MNLRFLETFVWISRLGSFTAAAGHLNSTQAAVSDRIAALERELGVELFQRGGRRVVLTDAGRRVLPRAELLLRQWESLRASVAPAATEGPARLRIAVGASIAQSFLPACLERLAREEPQVTIELVTAGSAVNATAELLADRIDLALLLGPVAHEAVENIDLCHFAIRWVASPRLALPEGPLGPADIAAHPVLSFPEGSAPHRHIRDWFAAAEVEEPRLHALQSMPIAIQLARDGVGIAALPPAILGEALAAGALRLLPVTEPLPPLHFTASFKRRAAPVIRRVAGMARESAAVFCRGCPPDVAFQLPLPSENPI